MLYSMVLVSAMTAVTMPLLSVSGAEDKREVVRELRYEAGSSEDFEGVTTRNSAGQVREAKVTVGAEARQKGMEGVWSRRTYEESEYDLFEMCSEFDDSGRHGGFTTISIPPAEGDAAKGTGVPIRALLWPIWLYEDMTAGAEGTEIYIRFSRRTLQGAPTLRVMLMDTGEPTEGLWIARENRDGEPIAEGEKWAVLKEPGTWLTVYFQVVGENKFKAVRYSGPHKRASDPAFHDRAVEDWKSARD